MADKKFLDAMKNKFSEDPTDKRTTFYNMGGWKQSERKSAFVKEGKEIAEKRGIPMYNPDIGTPLGQRALMSYQLSTTDTYVEKVTIYTSLTTQLSNKLGTILEEL